MPFTDRTSEFRALLTERKSALPEAKRRRLDRAAIRAKDETRDPLATEFVREAYHVVRPDDALRMCGF
jgi:hypothetical protein